MPSIKGSDSIPSARTGSKFENVSPFLLEDPFGQQKKLLWLFGCCKVRLIWKLAVFYEMKQTLRPIFGRPGSQEEAREINTDSKDFSNVQ